MRLKVVTAHSGSNLTTQETLEIRCGQGQQILRWLGYAACAQLSYRRGESLGRYVPQAVCKDNTVLDVDLVLSEVAADGDELLVEYSEGPIAFKARWEGRPTSPPLIWGGDDQHCEPSPTAWLQQLDFVAEGLTALQTADIPPPAAATAAAPPPPPPQAAPAAAVPAGAPAPAGAAGSNAAPAAAAAAAAAEADLSQVRSVLLQHAGALQMLFLLYTCEAAAPIESIHRMTLPQFKALLHAAKVTSSSLPPDKLDQLFSSVQTSPGGLQRRGQVPSSSPGFDLADFMVALVHMAHIRFVAESFATGATGTLLSTKLLSLLQDCIFAHLFPDLQRRVDKFKSAVTPAAQVLLRKGRRLTEQVLERCQVRRVQSPGPLCVDVRYVAKHLLQKWNVMGKDFKLPELVPAVIFAKQPSTDPYRFVVQPQPLALDYDEFEKLLLCLALLQARMRKRTEAFDEVLGELLDTVYKKSGVLPSAPVGATHGSTTAPSQNG